MAENAAKRKVLITGASGLIGQLTLKHLGDRYDFSALNRRPVEGIPCVQADIADLDAIRPAFDGVHTVLHLSAGTADVDDWELMLSTTVRGTANVFRAAQAAGVARVVFMGAGSVMCGYELDDNLPYGKLARGEYEQITEPWRLITYLDPVRPLDVYSIGKVFGEACGRWFADTYGMSVLVIRCGAVLPDDKPQLIRHFPGYLTRADIVQMVDKCLSAPISLKWGIFDCISDNQYRWRDTTPAKQVLGWQPTGTADIFDPDEFKGKK